MAFTSLQILSGKHSAPLSPPPETDNQYQQSCADSEGGGQGFRTTTLKNHKAIGFLSNTGPDPMKNHKTTKPVFNVGSQWARQQNAISIPFRWRANDRPLLVVFGSSLPSSTKKSNKKNVVRIGPPLTKLSGSAHELKFNLLCLMGYPDLINWTSPFPF